ncbi:glycosyltransferase family 69 protein [Zopfia rhizophila CBS 207.26]|uniref:Glycosyltransferase family 69 protein n=1 Tax=Zopfia rhizophila CBS 207.26 TaxID=1314779 RepID=A0A6A6EIT1_9PEZI|nr:glycosyltransferase family 69 protein [Zopfia rhizophila CBS 207.26]
MAESIPLYRVSQETNRASIDSLPAHNAKVFERKRSNPLLPFSVFRLLWSRRRNDRARHSLLTHTEYQNGITSGYPRKRRRRNRCFRLLFWLFNSCALFIIVSLLNGLLRPSYIQLSEHYLDLEKRILAASVQDGRGNPHNEKVFIAANIINEDLIRDSWGENLINLVRILGQDNVFISIYENDAGDGTRDALLELNRKLACNTSIVTGDHISLSNFPTVTTSSGEKRVKRPTYLAEVRNRVLLPLQSGPRVDHWERNHPNFRRAEQKFDKVLFLKDVFFNPVEAAQLLFSTNMGPNGRAEYSAACAIDFAAKVMFYDTSVVHDMEGYGMGLMFYPWFPPIGESQSRNDVLALKDAVRVRSCWGGMAAFDAEIFQPRVMEDNDTVPALQFRSIQEPYWEEADFCLLFADMEVRRAMLHEQGKGVFVNPYIRVAYSQVTWDWLPFWRRHERMFQFLQYIVSKIGYPEYNPRREHVAGARVEERVWVPEGDKGGGSFQNVERNADAGGWCGQRKMLVMKKDLGRADENGWWKNWENVKIPKGL